MSGLERIRRRYETHHRDRRDAGEFVFVPERVPLLVAAVGGPGRRVLDLGCRTGAVAEHLRARKRGHRSRRRLRRAPSARPSVASRRSTETSRRHSRSMIGPSTSWLRAKCSNTSEHPDEVVAEVRRVLRPAGIFVGSVPNAFRLQSRAALPRRASAGGRPDPSSHVLSSRPGSAPHGLRPARS